MNAVRRWLNPSRKPMTIQRAALRFLMVAAVLYLAINAVLLSGYGGMDWTTPVEEGCPSGGICGTWEVVK